MSTYYSSLVHFTEHLFLRFIFHDILLEVLVFSWNGKGFLGQLHTYHVSHFMQRFIVFHEKEYETINISLHTFCHFHEILIRCKKPLSFHQKTATSNEMTWNVKYEKDALWNELDIYSTHFRVLCKSVLMTLQNQNFMKRTKSM